MVNQWKKLYEREDVLKYLPYRDFDIDKGIYATTDDGFGLILSCSPLTSVSTTVESALESAFSVLPENAYIQFILYASPNVTKLVDSWEAGKIRTVTDDMALNIVKEYKDLLENKVSDYITENFLAPVRNFKLIITIKVGGKQKELNLFENLSNFDNFKKSIERYFKKFKGNEDDNQINDKKMKKDYNSVIQAKDRFLGSLKKAYLNPQIMSPNELIKFMYEVMNQNHNFRSIPKWDGSYINNFVFANDNKVIVKEDETIIDKKHIRTLSVKEYPEEWSFMDVIKYVGDTISNQNHSSPFLISLNINKLDNQKGAGNIKARATVTNGQQMPYSLFPKLRYIHKDLEYGMDKLEKGAIPYYFTIQLALFADSEQKADELSGQYKAYFKTLQFTLEDDKYITFPSLLSMLPLGYDSKMQEFLSDKRGRIVFLDNVTTLAPIVGDWYGLKEEVPLLSPKGQLFFMDLFANKAGGFNAFTVGMTGSGKSVWLQWVAINYYLSGNKIWVIDIGGSYKNLCEILGGQYIDFKTDEKMSINPFSDISSIELFNEYLEFITSLYLLMGLPKEIKLSEQLEKLMKGYLIEAITNSYTIYKTDSDVDTVVEELIKINEREEDPRLSDFIKHLSPFRTNNIYGSYLNGTSNVSFRSDMTVLEAGELESTPDLLNVVLMVLTFQISKEIYLSDNKNENINKKNIVIMDEAHKFLGTSPHIELFVEQAYRRFRKHGASMILGTQGFEDLYGGNSVSKVGRVIIENSYWNFFLMQKSTSREKLKKSGYFSLSSYEELLMDTTEPEDGEYGEILILSDKITTKGRIVLNDFLKTMLFTNSEMRIKINQLVNSGMTYLEAVNTINGVNSGNNEETIDKQIL